jgi:tRNA nucleotidyltransferase (CCA-adding enzyme)
MRVTARSQFMTYKLRSRAFAIDLAACREETYPNPGALPVVAPATQLEDLHRRDFTVNAMALSLSPAMFGMLIDPHGGLDDLREGTIRILHWSSFRDDATRMLRALRFEQRLGGTLDPATRTLMARDARFIETISPDRLRREFERVWKEGRPEEIMARAYNMGLLEAVSPSIPWDQELESAFSAGRSVTPLDIPVGSLYFALLGARLDVAKAKTLAARLNLPEEQRSATVDAARLRKRVDGVVMKGQQPSAATANLERFSPAALQAWNLLAENREVSKRLRDYLLLWRNMRPLLTGTDLLEMGAPQGPLIGKMLRALRAARLDNPSMTKDDERDLALHLLDLWLNGKPSRKRSASG